jgi:hypothetical protein
MHSTPLTSIEATEANEVRARSAAVPPRSWWILLLCLAIPNPAGAAATLTVETTTRLPDWSPAPIAPGQVTPDGRLVVPGDSSAALYRLAIGNSAGPLRGTAEVPAPALTLATEFLDRHNAALADGAFAADTEPDFDGPLALGPVAAIYHDPAVDDGRTPAYVEFKLLRPRVASPPATGGAFFGGRPEEKDARPDAGYVTVSLTPNDRPIAAYAFAGSTRYERLLARVPAVAPVARILRFDDAFMVAEDTAGRALASLGSAPYIPDPAVLSIPPDGYELELGTAALPPAVGPALTARQAESYADFVGTWKTNPVLRRILEARAAAAEEAWLFAGDGPKTVEVGLRQTVVLNSTGPAAIRAASAAPEVIRVDVDASSGRVQATAVANGESLVTLWQADGTRTVCLVATPDPAPGALHGQGRPVPHKTWIPGKQAGWYMAGTHYVSSWDEQRRYNQVENDSQMCSGTVSGCGPTAWAMYFGHWDRKGYPKLFADAAVADAPQFMGNPINPSVLACLRYVFDAVDEVCFDKLDRAATLPHKMHLGLQWSSSRGVGSTGNIKWGVPYLSPGSQDKALDSLRAGRVSIVGIGVYSHYPLAYGYRRWEWRGKYGTVWNVDYDLRCNMGWGSSHEPEWRNIGQLWYATHIRPQ